MEDILHKVTEGLKHYEYEIEFGKMGNYDLTPGLEKEMEAIYTRLNKKQKNLTALIADIKKYISAYPNILPFQNYLYCAYMQLDDYDTAKKINENILATHPDYLTGILNRAAFYIMDEDFDKVPEVLGNMLELGELMPERKKFHISEFLGFNKLVILYACSMDNLDLANNRLEIMEKIAPDFPDTEFAREAIMKKNLERSMERMRESQEKCAEYNGVEKDYVSLPQITDEPVFNHPEIADLYCFSLHIDKERIREILALPRETLVKDLQEVIYDSIRRFQYYNKEVWVEENRNFLLHAMILLAELKASEALPALLEILKQGDDYLRYWFDDLLTEDIWEIYYQVFNLQAYVEYLREPRHYTFAKSLIAEVLVQKTIGGELNREDALATYESLLEYFIDNRKNQDILDPNFMGGLISDICNAQLVELLPIIKMCFDYDMVDEWVCGDYQSIEKDIHNSTYRKKRELKITGGFENFYTGLKNGIISYNEGESEDDEMWDNDEYEEAHIVKQNEQIADLVLAKKITVGRNDPCPCGSGKKFKKCCME